MRGKEGDVKYNPMFKKPGRALISGLHKQMNKPPSNSGTASLARYCSAAHNKVPIMLAIDWGNGIKMENTCACYGHLLATTVCCSISMLSAPTGSYFYCKKQKYPASAVVAAPILMLFSLHSSELMVTGSSVIWKFSLWYGALQAEWSLLVYKLLVVTLWSESENDIHDITKWATLATLLKLGLYFTCLCLC